jgi:hypothetical protein
MSFGVKAFGPFCWLYSNNFLLLFHFLYLLRGNLAKTLGIWPTLGDKLFSRAAEILDSSLKNVRSQTDKLILHQECARSAESWDLHFMPYPPLSPVLQLTIYNIQRVRKYDTQ